MKNYAVVILFLICALIWLLFTYTVPIVCVILILKGHSIGWPLLISWSITASIGNIIGEIRNGKKHSRK